MSYQKALKFWFIQYLIDPLLRRLFASCTLKITGQEAFLEAAKNKKLILSLWHENMLLVPYFLSTYWLKLKMSAVISKSRDGQLIESLKANHANLDTIQVAHDGKHNSLKAMLKAIESQRLLIITPDGPRGPWRKAKAGVGQLAIWSEAEIWALRWKSSGNRSLLHLPTPDRMKLPYPFQTLEVEFIRIGPIVSREELLEKAHLIEKALS